jgi:hypothetical protein
VSISGGGSDRKSQSAATDSRRAKLKRYERRLFPELICPTHDEVGQEAWSSKPTDLVWCNATGKSRGHWFRKEAA